MIDRIVTCKLGADLFVNMRFQSSGALLSSDWREQSGRSRPRSCQQYGSYAPVQYRDPRETGPYSYDRDQRGHAYVQRVYIWRAICKSHSAFTSTTTTPAKII